MAASILVSKSPAGPDIRVPLRSSGVSGDSIKHKTVGCAAPRPFTVWAAVFRNGQPLKSWRAA